MIWQTGLGRFALSAVVGISPGRYAPKAGIEMAVRRLHCHGQMALAAWPRGVGPCWATWLDPAILPGTAAPVNIPAPAMSRYPRKARNRAEPLTGCVRKGLSEKTVGQLAYPARGSSHQAKICR